MPVENTPHWTPPVRSSRFPGPSVCVWGAITHRVPRLPLSAFCTFMILSTCHTAAVSAASLWSDWTGREFEGRGWKGSDGEAAGMRWEAGLIWDGTRFFKCCVIIIALQMIDGHGFLVVVHIYLSTTLQMYRGKLPAWYSDWIPIFLPFYTSFLLEWLNNNLIWN